MCVLVESFCSVKNESDRPRSGRFGDEIVARRELCGDVGSCCAAGMGSDREVDKGEEARGRAEVS